MYSALLGRPGWILDLAVLISHVHVHINSYAHTADTGTIYKLIPALYIN